MSESGKAARPMKDGLGEPAVLRLGSALATAWPGFDARGFRGAALEGLGDLELKDRVRHLIAVMDAHLPRTFEKALEVVEKAGACFPAGDPQDNLAGFAAWPLIDWVPTRGLDHFDPSLSALRRLTPLFSAEFAVRPFLLADPRRALRIMEPWTRDESEHVRRLVSEGTRPRLPWGCRLPMFIADPRPVLTLLEKLKDDPAEYVRRSVANNLNDIAKDHPRSVTKACRVWRKKASPQRKWLVRHGLRTLVKQGDRDALAILGFTTNPRVKVTMRLSKDALPIGENLEIQVELASLAKERQKLVVDYVVHHVRSNGKTTPKVFKLKNLDLAPGASVAFTKKHSFLPRSVRRYYPGRHRVELLVGGRVLAAASFTMTD